MRRSKYDICADILQATLNRVNKTRLVYASNLNFNVGNTYLSRLIEKGFLEITDDGYYLTTSKGAQFLKEYNDLLALMNDIVSSTNESVERTQEIISKDPSIED